MDGVAQRTQELYSDATPGGGQLYAEGVLEGIRPDLNSLQEFFLRRERRGVSCTTSGFTDIPEVAVIAGEELDEVPLIGEDALDAIQLGGVGNYAEGDGGINGLIPGGPDRVVDVGDIEGGEDIAGLAAGEDADAEGGVVFIHADAVVALMLAGGAGDFGGYDIEGLGGVVVAEADQHAFVGFGGGILGVAIDDIQGEQNRLDLRPSRANARDSGIIEVGQAEVLIYGGIIYDDAIAYAQVIEAVPAYPDASPLGSARLLDIDITQAGIAGVLTGGNDPRHIRNLQAVIA